MQSRYKIAGLNDPGLLFCAGLAAVMLAMTVSIPPVWNTFIYPWRVELTASLFLLATISYFAINRRMSVPPFDISRDELLWLVFPVCAFIVWSAASMMWSASWRSALHHTLVWSEYLIFYIAIRQMLDRGSNFVRLQRTFALTLGFFAVLAVVGYCSFLVLGGGTQLGIVYAKYGEQINTLFPLLTVGILRLNGKRFVGGAALLTALWLLIFCSLSRTNLFLFTIAFFAVAITIFCFKRFHKYRQKTAVLILAFVLAPVPLHAFSLISDDPGIPMVKRVSNTEAIGSSNNFRKLMLSIGSEMIAAHPFIGVGADNFGVEANKYREIYAARDPDDVNLVEAENDIPERAHNEYLQILAETGTVGTLIFLWLLFGIGRLFWRALERRKTISLFPIAALIGIAAFLASSLVTSYSFRLMQNGFVFFFVVAVAAKLLFKSKAGIINEPALAISPRQIKFACAVAAIVCLLLIGTSSIRVASVALATEANNTPDLDAAMPLYATAMRLDRENAEAPYFLGLRLIDKARYAEAIPYLQNPIRMGKARSADFSFLATSQTLAGDTVGAERTFAEAAAMYPRSPFVLTRYAALLKENGKTGEMAVQLERAAGINPKQAKTWWVMITESPQAAADLTVHGDDSVPLMDLQPQTAMYAVKAEREIRHPEERFSFSFQAR
ncbi:MAG TPA: O-antigen ligase family protein [Pyrinomonadaceae bacterium]|nr:O-antigen ligase family protein [Pyrinomonadaceae bacterium]